MPANDVAQDPATTMTADQAHHTMQNHLACDTARCPHRQAALRILIEAGRYTLTAT